MECGTNLITQNIKNGYLEHMEQYNVPYGEIINAARRIKIWYLIGKEKQKNERLRYDCFFGWLQFDAILRLTVVDITKLCKDISRHIFPIVNKILTPEKSEDLIKNSKLQYWIRELRKKVNDGNLKLYRDKLFAHLDPGIINLTDSIRCDLGKIFFILAMLVDSLNYISHLLLNPRHMEAPLIIENRLDASDLPKVDNGIDISCYLNSYLNDDPTIKQFQQMLLALAVSEIKTC